MLVHVPLAAQPAPEPASGLTAKQPVQARRFMVAAANPLAVDAGHSILRRGGSAVDAAVAVQMVLNLVEPQSSGIGGGAFLLHHGAPDGRLRAYDGRETAPAAATPERFINDGRPVAFHEAAVGGRSVGVPGTVAMLELAHRRHGRLPWARLFDPAIALAEEGFAVSPRLHAVLKSERFLMADARARAYFYEPDGTPRAVGHRLRNPEFAATLRQIAREGGAAFYRGAIARDIVDTVRAHPTQPGDLTLEDLAGYAAVVREPVCSRYRAYRVCGMPPPSSGALTVSQMLGVLERFDMRSHAPGSLMAVHLFAEAGRLAYADRNVYIADPDFVPVPAGLLDRRYLAARSSTIVPGRTMGRAAAGEPPGSAAARKVAGGVDSALELPSTSHVSVVDHHGNAVALTTTIEDAFGSRLLTRSGFLLNNELTDFSFAPVDGGRPVANRVEARKRPRSSMAPTIVYDRAGRVFMVVGSPGGSAIINYVAKTLVGVLDWGLDPQRAIDLPNVGSRNGPTELEAGTPAEALEAKLQALGHDTRVMPHTSGLQAIVRTRGGWIGGADPRREGTVRGE